MSELDDVGSETTSLEDSLSAAFDGATPTDNVTPPEPTPVSPASGQLEPLKAPQHWTEADKTLFATAPQNIQQRWLDRENEIRRGLDSKFQEIAGFRKEREAYQEILKPYERELQLNGVSAPQFFGALLGWHQLIRENPREGLQRLSQMYGIDPAQLTEQQQNNPEVAKVSQKLSSVENNFEKFKQEVEKARHQQNLNAINGFADAKNADGSLAHPFFDELGEDIKLLMRVSPGIGLEEAYNKALRLNDEIYQKVQANKASEQAKQKDAERLAAVEKAKRAAVATTQGVAKGNSKKMSLEDELSARWDGTYS